MSQPSKLDRTQRPEIRDIPFLRAPMTENVTFANGVEAVILDRGEEKVTRLTFSWVGGRHDSDSPAALMLLSQLLKEGSSNLSPEAMADLLDSNGAWLESELHPHHLSLTLYAINSTIGRVLPAIVDTIGSPSFPLEQLSTAKARLIAEHNLLREKVEYQAKLIESPRIYGRRHPAAREVAESDFAAVTRADIAGIYDRQYRRQPPVVYIAGNIDAATRGVIFSELQRLQSTAGDIPTKRLIPFEPDDAGGEAHAECPGSLQSAVRITIPAIPRSHPDYESLRAVVTALGGYFGSRLMKVIREEKGLTYGISAMLLGHHEGAFVTVASQCDNRYADQVIDGTLREIDRLASEPMDREELDTLRRYASSNIIATFDTPFTAIDYFITHRHTLTPPDYLERQQIAIASLTPEKIMDLAKRYLADAPKYISVAGSKSGEKM